MAAKDIEAPKLEWAFSIQTDGTIKLALKDPSLIDRKTAQGAALAYLALEDLLVSEGTQELQAKLEEIRDKAWDEAATALLSDELIKSIRTAMNANRQRDRRWGPNAEEIAKGALPDKWFRSKIVKEVANKDGTKVFEAERTTEFSKEVQGKWQRTTHTSKFRITCMFDGSNWGVARLELWRKSIDSKGKETHAWKDFNPIGPPDIWGVGPGDIGDPGPIPEMNSAEDAARVAHWWLAPHIFMAGTKAVEKADAAIRDLKRECFVAEYRRQSDEFMLDWQKKFDTDAKAAHDEIKSRKIADSKTLENGDIEVSFAPKNDRDLLRPVCVVMTKTDKGWRVKSARLLRAPNNGTAPGPVQAYGQFMGG